MICIKEALLWQFRHRSAQFVGLKILLPETADGMGQNDLLAYGAFAPVNPSPGIWRNIFWQCTTHSVYPVALHS